MMMTSFNLRVAVACALVALGGAALLAACQTDNTEAVVVNELPADAPAPLTVYRVWYRSTLFLDPVAPGEQSEALRVGSGEDEPAYALLAPAYAPDDPDAGPPPLVPARTRAAVRTEPGDKTRLVFSRANALIGCDGPDGLSKEDYETITGRIFPGELVAGCGAAPVQP